MEACWSYSGTHGCCHWREKGFSPANAQEQSPINIQTNSCQSSLGTGSTALTVRQLGAFSGNIENTGFTSKVVLNQKMEHIEVEGENYGLVQFHFHSPTEHTIDDVFHPLELHLVHESMTNRGKLAVIAVMFEVGAQSEFLKGVLPLIPPTYSSGKLQNPMTLRGLKIEPKYWNYKGSLTTPPCTEGVKWIVLKKTHTLSREQLSEYLKLFPMDTNRPVQPINHRIVRSIE